LISSPTTSPVAAAASKTSDVAPNAPTAGEAVAPISTSSSGRVRRRPTCILGPSLLFFFSAFLCSLVIRVGTTTNLEGGSGRSIDLL
jgi:hypothetical protein